MINIMTVTRVDKMWAWLRGQDGETTRWSREQADERTAEFKSQRNKRKSKLEKIDIATAAQTELADMGEDVSRGARVRRKRALQEVGRAAQHIMKPSRTTSARAQMVQRARAEFNLEGRRVWAGSSAAPEMEQALQMAARSRGNETWIRLLPAWKRARAYLSNRMERDGRTLTIETLRERQWMVTAAAVHAYNTQSSVGCVRDCFQATSKAMGLNGIRAERGLLGDIVAQVTLLEQSTALRKVAAFDLSEIDSFAKNWGRRSQPMNRRQTALIAEWSFEHLLRFADTAVLNTFFMYWMKKDLMFKIMSRKTTRWQCSRGRRSRTRARIA
jgi:hypothetical protein